MSKSKALLKRGQVQKGFRPSLKKAPVEVEENEGSILEEVEEELKREGIVPFDNSNIMEDFLILPADLTVATSQDLGRYFNAFTKQKMYCRTLLGRTSAILREAEEELDGIRESIFFDLPVKMSLKEKELKLRANSRATELLNQVARIQEKKNMLSIYLDNLIDGIFNISREISRRESDMNDEFRSNSLDNKRRR